MTPKTLLLIFIAALLCSNTANAVQKDPVYNPNWCAENVYSSKTFDCSCVEEKAAAMLAARPGLAPEIVQGRTGEACPNGAGIQAQEFQRCSDSPSLYVPAGIAVAAYCSCYSSEIGKAWVAHAPKRHLGDESGRFSSAAKAHCKASVREAAAPPIGADLSGFWRLDVGGMLFRVEVPRNRVLVDLKKDGTRVRHNYGLGVPLNGSISSENASISARTDAQQRLHLNADSAGVSGCEGAVIPEGFAGSCAGAYGKSIPFTFKRDQAAGAGPVAGNASPAPPPAPAPATPQPPPADGAFALTAGELILVPLGEQLARTAKQRVIELMKSPVYLAMVEKAFGQSPIDKDQNLSEPARVLKLAETRSSPNQRKTAAALMAHLIDKYPDSPEAASAQKWLLQMWRPMQALKQQGGAADLGTPTQYVCPEGPYACQSACLVPPKVFDKDTSSRMEACGKECKQRCPL